jgi:hypothetical protein
MSPGDPANNFVLFSPPWQVAYYYVYHGQFLVNFIACECITQPACKCHQRSQPALACYGSQHPVYWECRPGYGKAGPCLAISCRPPASLKAALSWQYR